MQHAIRHKDGEIRHVEERGQGVYGEAGEVEAIEGARISIPLDIYSHVIEGMDGGLADAMDEIL
jgi:hypothetical protein